MKVSKGFFVVLAFFIALFLSATVGYTQSPSASFVANPLSGSLSPPAGIQFTDTSTENPTWWLWEFGDGKFSLAQHPLYTYQQPGIYPLTLTVVNAAGVDSVTEDYIVQECGDPLPYKLEGGGSFSTIMEAYNAAVLLGWNIIPIALKAGTYTEDLRFDADASVRLKGGYDCSFQNNYGKTSILGSLTIVAGTVTPSNVKIISIINEYLCDGLDNDGDTLVDENLIPPPCLRQQGVCAGSFQACNGFSGWSGADSPECYADLPNYEVTETICDGLDNDCDGQVDEEMTFDVDGDGSTSIGSCGGSADDCDDDDPYNFPGNTEICDSFDNNCDGQIDEGWVPEVDTDGDGYSAIGSCGSGDDCNDNDAGINPGAVDIYGDGIDQDCDGTDIALNENICFSCHSVGWVDIRHAGVAAPAPSCIPCHSEREASVRTGHYGDIVRTADNNMTVGSTIRCRSCHDFHVDEEYHIPGAYFVWVKVHAVGADNVTCYTCHENLDVDHETGNAHDNRLIENTCSQCHTSDTSVLGSPGTGTLATDADVFALHRSDCTLCHAYTGTKIDLATIEQVILTGLYGTPIICIDCHYDFTTIHQNLDHTSLVTVGTTSCGNCHSDPPPMVAAADPKVHNACTSCHDVNYGLKSLAVGKSFAVGGDCTTCHGDHFPNHSHHSGVYNDVTYNVVVDTSQALQQGCALCHTDYDMINASSLGLSTWETILVEHDLDGTKDGSTNTCDNCHAYDGSNSAPLAAVQNAIASGNPATCATCHTDKVPTVPHNIPTSGKHPVHLVLTGFSCTTCHYTVNYPYFKSGTDIDGDNLYNLIETDVCENCHKAAWYD